MLYWKLLLVVLLSDFKVVTTVSVMGGLSATVNDKPRILFMNRKSLAHFEIFVL